MKITYVKQGDFSYWYSKKDSEEFTVWHMDGQTFEMYPGQSM